jgi:ATP-dependent helicase HrpB
VLPIDAYLPTIKDALVRHRAVVVTAAPGAGKTTRVPPALVDDGPVLVLQPRRVAARSMARRIAEQRGWTLGREVGWHIRFERRVSAETRVTLATEGVLTARLQQDPLLADVATVVFDEFHERSIHADLGLAFARQAWLARDDLRIVVMSATMAAAPVAAFLNDCPIVDVPGRLHPLDVSYLPGVDMPDAVRRAMVGSTGAVLCFLPGAGDIARVAQELAGDGWPIRPLHGRLSGDDQDAALTASASPRVVLATNLAETTVTVPDVTTVVDSGWQKVARYDAGRGIDRLVAERISDDSARQRAGRAGRTGPGRVYRLWDRQDRLRPQREPEIMRVDLAGPLLEVIAWGGHPSTFEWFEAPPAWAVEAGVNLLVRLGAVDRHGALTTLGRQMRSVALHPRLARLLLSATDRVPAARVCAALTDGARMPASLVGQARHSDLDVFADARVLTPFQRELARQLAGSTGSAGPTGPTGSVERAVFEAFPDRVARRRAPGRPACVLATGTGAVLARESGVVTAEYFVAVDVGGAGLPGQEPLVRMASGIDPSWLVPTSVTVEHSVDRDSGRVRAVRIERYDALVLREIPVAAEPDAAARVLLAAWRARGPSDADRRLLRRLRCAGLDVDVEQLAATAVVGAVRLDDVRLSAALPGHVRAQLDRAAPEALRMPSGRDMPIDYRDDGALVVSVKLQEVFGLRDTPRIGPSAIPVTFELLAPNQRPVQVTSDLASFWSRGYPDVRKQLRGRYPKHPWPEDPWTATPTHRTRRQC